MPTYFRKIFWLLLAGLFIGLVWHSQERLVNYPQRQISIAAYKLNVRVAYSMAQKYKGLSGQTHLAENQGMLFIYNWPQKLSFWMYRMQFPLDIIWLDSKQRIIYMVVNVPPCPLLGTCPVYTPPAQQLAQYVLETKAGFTQRHHVQVGQYVKW